MQGSDEWAALCITRLNHQISYYVDANVGAHTQYIKRSWLDVDFKLLKEMRGVSLNRVQTYSPIFIT